MGCTNAAATPAETGDVDGRGTEGAAAGTDAGAACWIAWAIAGASVEAPESEGTGTRTTGVVSGTGAVTGGVDETGCVYS